jgi:carbon storage regulator
MIFQPGGGGVNGDVGRADPQQGRYDPGHGSPGARHRAVEGTETMLVLSRRVGERIVIDGGIVVTVAQVKGNQVRISLEAPPRVGIYREEVLLGLDVGTRQGGGVSAN